MRSYRRKVKFAARVRKKNMKWIALSFDDGEVQDKRLCALLRKYRLKATFGICCGYLGQSGILFSGRRYSKVSAEDLASVYEEFELCSHGYFHRDFTKLCEAELQEEVMRDCDCIREKTGQYPIGVIYPGGLCSDAVCAVLRKSFSFGRTAGASHSFALPEDFLRWEPTCHMFDKKIYELADAFEQSEGDAALSIFGHSYELDEDGGWERAEKLFDRLNGMRGVVSCSMGEIYAFFQKK